MLVPIYQYPFQFGRALFFRSARKIGLLNESKNTLTDQLKDRILPFDEYPVCEMCSSDSAFEVLIAMDGSRIVECDHCGLWFTSPRINEDSWCDYLKTETERSIEFTENRLKYGCALKSNIKFSHPLWRRIKKNQHDVIFDAIESKLGRTPEKIHDVGCGVGFLLQDANSRGITASGNELNKYACSVMSDRLDLTVYNDIFPKIKMKNESLDAIVMRDYIEHTYHPLADLRAAHSYLKDNGILYVETFHTNCSKFEELKKNWNMLFWNHVYHFSDNSLKDMIKKAGFTIIDIKSNFKDILVKIIAKKMQ